MTFLLATIIYPVLLAALALGAGLLVDRAAGRIVPGVLLLPIGLALLVALSELLAWQDATGGLVPVALVVVALAGYGLGWLRLRRRAIDWWPVAAAIATYVIVCAPVLLSGRVTVPGYLLDTTVAFHLLGSDYLLEHARNFSELPVGTFRTTLESYFGHSYPSGGQTLLGGSGRLVGIERIWVYLPFLSMLLAACSQVLYYLARAGELPRWLAAGAGLLAATPALVYAYAQMGAIKEIGAMPFILLLGALLVMLPRLLAGGWRAACVPAAVIAAGVGAIGVSYAPWAGLAAMAAVGLTLIAPEPRPTLRQAGLFVAGGAVVLVLLALPTVVNLADSIRLAESFSTSNAVAVADPGNLVRPLLKEQMLGVWLTGSHRGDPGSWFHETYLLIGVAALLALLGAVFLIRRRLWSLAVWVVLSAIAWVVLTRRGTTWTDAKLLVLTSPVVVLMVAFGIESLRRAGRTVEAGIVASVIALGILASNAFTYHDTNLLPTDRYEELLDINDRFGNDRATLVPEFDEFTVYALQNLPPDGPGFSFKSGPLVTLRDGTPTPYGTSFDVDQIPLETVETYDTIVVRRRPDASRPPANYDNVFDGDFYDVWRRNDDQQVLEHLPAGGGFQPARRVRCSAVRRLAQRARADGASLSYVTRPRLVTIDPRKATRPDAWTDAAPIGIGLGGPGRLEERFEVPETSRYRIWLRGEIGRRLRVLVDGREIGSVASESGNDGNYDTPIDVELDAGRHELAIERGGGSLRPGDNTPSLLRAIVIEPLDTAAEVQSATPDGWREICAQPVDWVEVVKPA